VNMLVGSFYARYLSHRHDSERLAATRPFTDLAPGTRQSGRGGPPLV